MFKKAEKKSSKLKLAITGPSGSGKTYSALRLATGMAKKIAVIDTENGSASLYADKFNFDVIEIQPPFEIEKYTRAIEAAEKANYDVLIIDSLSHAWAGEGGLLEQKSNLDSRPNSNHWTNWNPITKQDNRFKNAFLHSPCHIICTMRSKQEYVQVEENGKKKIQKLGMAPVQREGLEYEFTVVFDIAMDHKAEASKDRTTLFVGKVFQVTEETGKELSRWLGQPPKQAISIPQNEPTRTALMGEDVPSPSDEEIDLFLSQNQDTTFDQYPEPVLEPKSTIANLAEKVSVQDVRDLIEHCKKNNIPNDYVKTVLNTEFGGVQSKDLMKLQYKKLMKILSTGGLNG